MCVPYICPQQNLWAFICLCLCLGVHVCACVRTAGCVLCLCLPLSLYVSGPLSQCVWLLVYACLHGCVWICVCLSVSVSKGYRMSLICACLSGRQAAPWNACLYPCVPAAFV